MMCIIRRRKKDNPNEKETKKKFAFLFLFFLNYFFFLGTPHLYTAPLPSCSLTSAGFLSNKSQGPRIERKKERKKKKMLFSSYSKEREKTKTHSTVHSFFFFFLSTYIIIIFKRYSRRFSFSFLTYINCVRTTSQPTNPYGRLKEKRVFPSLFFFFFFSLRPDDNST
jgi:hypothetical protein